MIAEPTDFRDELFLHDLPESPTDHDLLEEQQRAMLRQQEDDLRQMKNGRPGNFVFVLLHGISTDTEF